MTVGFGLGMLLTGLIAILIGVEGLRADLMAKDQEIGRLMHKINVKK